MIFFKDKLLQIIEKFLNGGNIKETMAALISTAHTQKLFYLFGVRRVTWFSFHLENYLKFIHPNSDVDLKRCLRFSKDDFNGVMVTAKKDIKSHKILAGIFGIYRPLNEIEINILTQQNLNFSIAKATSSSKSQLLLGTVAFINHDCNPNCIYVSIKKSVVSVKTLRDIKKAEELLVMYDSNYFGNNNEDCECYTCKKQSE